MRTRRAARTAAASAVGVPTSRRTGVSPPRSNICIQLWTGPIKPLRNTKRCHILMLSQRIAALRTCAEYTRGILSP